MGKPPIITNAPPYILPKPSLTPTLQIVPLPPIPNPSLRSDRLSLKNKKIIEYFNNKNQERLNNIPLPHSTPSLTTPIHRKPSPSNTEAAWSGRKVSASENVRGKSQSEESAAVRSNAAGASQQEHSGTVREEDDIRKNNTERVENKTNSKTLKEAAKNKMDKIKIESKSKNINKNKTNKTKNNKKEAAKVDKNARKMTDFWVPKAEVCSSPVNISKLVSGIAYPDVSIEDSGSLQNANPGENLSAVKTMGHTFSQTKGLVGADFLIGREDQDEPSRTNRING